MNRFFFFYSFALRRLEKFKSTCFVLCVWRVNGTQIKNEQSVKTHKESLSRDIKQSKHEANPIEITLTISFVLARFQFQFHLFGLSKTVRPTHNNTHHPTRHTRPHQPEHDTRLSINNRPLFLFAHPFYNQQQPNHQPPSIPFRHHTTPHRTAPHRRRSPEETVSTLTIANY